MGRTTVPIAAKFAGLVLAIVLLSPSCRRTSDGAGDGGTDARKPVLVGEVPAGEQSAWELARPVFEEYCTKCHTTAGSSANATALKHLSLDAYPPGGMHGAEAGSAIQTVLGMAGEPATMPADRPGSVQGDALERVRAWAKAFQQARLAVPTSAPPHHEH